MSIILEFCGSTLMHKWCHEFTKICIVVFDSLGHKKDKLVPLLKYTTQEVGKYT